jgi:hypothetical protein
MRYFFSLFLILSIISNAQETTINKLDRIAAKLINQYSAEARELVALHTDKSTYRAGSNIWFRAYLFSSNGFPVKEKNTILFVDLVNQKDSVVDRALLNLDSLQYHGALSTAEYLSEGFYQLRAYTKTIIKEHPADIFMAPVYIVNGKKATTDSYTNEVDSEDPIVRFYPEGNNIINGVSSTIIYTASDKYGNPAEISGIVRDNKDTIVAKFNGFGIGQFSFEPYSKDRTYKAYIKTKKNSDLLFSLPEISAVSYQLSLLEKTDNQLIFRVALGDSLYKKKASSYLIAVADGKPCFASAGTGMYMVNVPLKNIPNGIADFYLFNENEEMVSKRSVFIENNTVKLTISTDRSEYYNRNKANFNISITNGEGKPVRAVLSVSVTDNEFTGSAPPLHCAYNFLIQRNGIHLLSTQSTQTDLLLPLVRDNRQLMETNPHIKENNFYWDGLEIKGRIQHKNGIGLPNDLIVLSNPENKLTFSDSTDNSGAYAFRSIVFTGIKQFSVMLPALYEKQKNYNIIEEPALYPGIVSYSALNYRMSATQLKAVTEFKKIQADSLVTGISKFLLQQLAIAETTDKKKNLAPKKGLQPYRITAEMLDKLNLSNTVDALKMVPGVIMMNNRLTIRGGLQSLALGQDLSNVEPLLIVNGVSAANTSVVDYLNSIPPSNIEYIDVLTGPEAALYGTRAGNGVISVKTTNQIRLNQHKNDKELPTILIRGFHKEPSFFIPSYEIDAVRQANFTDNRTTIYWNGEIIPNTAGRASFSFYTADLKNDYKVTVEGITDKGELIYQSYLLKKK